MRQLSELGHEYTAMGVLGPIQLIGRRLDEYPLVQDTVIGVDFLLQQRRGRLLVVRVHCRAVITHKYRGSQQFSRVEYSTQIYRFDTRGAKEYFKY